MTAKPPSAPTPPPQPAALRPIPPLPATHHWHPQTTAWWEDVWSSPMASQWLAADRHVLIRTAVLVNEFWHRPTAMLLSEIRQQEARFGLTPFDRHRLQWKIEAETADKDDEGAAPPPPANDPREGLRLVK